MPIRALTIASLSVVACLLLTMPSDAPRAQPAGPQLAFLEESLEGDFALEGHIKAPAGWPEAAEVRIAFNYLDEKHYYYAQFTANAAALFKVAGGVPTRIGRHMGIKPATLGESIYFAVKRRQWRMAVICGNGLAALAFDDEYAGGRAATLATSTQLTFEDVALQETAPILLTDDFVREGGRMADWESVSGTWQSTGIPSAQQYASRSANAFAFTGIANDLAFATAGYWFWDCYDFSASVKGEDADAMAVACCVTEPDTYLLFRWSAGPNGTKQLIAVRGGEKTLLAEEPGGYEPGQWYKLTLRTQWTDFQALIDGQLVLRARNAPLAQGGIGLYLEGGKGTFDDVHVASYESFGDDFASGDASAWETVSGQWRASDGVLHVAGPSSGHNPCKAVAGRPEWRDYVFAADVRPAARGTVGLCFGYRSEDSYYAFAWDGTSNSAELREVSGGSVTSLAKANLAYSPAKAHRLKVATDSGYLRAYVDDKLVLEALEPNGTPGKIGVLAGGSSGAWFDNVVVWFAEPPPSEPPITEQFTAEATMGTWAGPLREWVYVQNQQPRLYLTKRTFYGDFELSMLLPALREDGKFGVVIGAGLEKLTGACGLSLAPGASPGRVNVRLSRGATELFAGDAAILPDADNTLRVGRRGPHVYCVIGEALVCQARDAVPAGPVLVGLQVDNVYPRLTRADLRAAQVCDYTFSEAPTEWYAQRGIWATTDRWPCQRGWAWLAGTQDVVPILWSKRAFSGDMTVEVYSAMVMDLPSSPGYSHPSDVNVSICGNGRDISSGYSFILAGMNNTASLLMRKSDLIAKNESMRFIDPVSSNADFHRHWFYSRVEKRGRHISYQVDGRLVAEFDDPQPLAGGHIALWSNNNNGLTVARVRISYADGGEITALPELRLSGEPVRVGDAASPAESASAPVRDNFEADAGQWHPLQRDGRVALSLDGSTRSEGRRSLRITNATTGGYFGVVAVPGPIRLAEMPVLSFAYRLPPEAKVNIHLRANGSRDHAIVFSGPDSFPSYVRRLGQIEGVVADHKWHTARFDLLAALRALYPESGDFEVRDLAFASNSAQPYLLCGFGGNSWGASYNIDDFRLAP